MLCSIYKSPKKEGTYLYVEKKDDFSQVPEALLKMFGRPVLVMTMSLAGKTLANVDIEKVQVALKDNGFFLQLPPPPENLLESYKARKAARQEQQ